ncbi:hypothetical protein BB987_21020 [Photorhabdus temperata]|nr:hypothetical protein BB987_21020 [Photorhabdus temperata]
MREDVAHRYIWSEAAVVERDRPNIGQGKNGNPGLMLTRQIPFSLTQNQAIGSKVCAATTASQ